MWYDEQMMGHSEFISVVVSIIFIMVIMCIISFIGDDPYRKLRKAFIFNHDNIPLLGCRLDPPTRFGKDPFKFVLISEILADDTV